MMQSHKSKHFNLDIGESKAPMAQLKAESRLNSNHRTDGRHHKVNLLKYVDKIKGAHKNWLVPFRANKTILERGRLT